MSKLITSGCGISQRDFKHYPIWVHFPTISHKLKHISIGGPAVGNEYIGRTCKKHILENLDVEAVIIQWTSIGKLDLFVENENTLDEIKDFNLLLKKIFRNLQSFLRTDLIFFFVKIWTPPLEKKFKLYFLAIYRKVFSE